MVLAADQPTRHDGICLNQYILGQIVGEYSLFATRYLTVNIAPKVETDNYSPFSTKSFLIVHFYFILNWKSILMFFFF